VIEHCTAAAGLASDHHNFSDLYLSFIFYNWVFVSDTNHSRLLDQAMHNSRCSSITTNSGRPVATPSRSWRKRQLDKIWANQSKKTFSEKSKFIKTVIITSSHHMEKTDAGLVASESEK